MSTATIAPPTLTTPGRWSEHARRTPEGVPLLGAGKTDGSFGLAYPNGAWRPVHKSDELMAAIAKLHQLEVRLIAEPDLAESSRNILRKNIGVARVHVKTCRDQWLNAHGLVAAHNGRIQVVAKWHIRRFGKFDGPK